MSRYRASFVLKDGTVVAYPFLKREKEAKEKNRDLDTSVLKSPRGWRVIAIAARGAHTFTLERDSKDKQRQIKCQTGDGSTQLLEIEGIKTDTLIDRIFPGDECLILLYQDNTFHLVRDGSVVAGWSDFLQTALGDHYGKAVQDVHVGGLFCLIRFMGGRIFCVRKLN